MGHFQGDDQGWVVKIYKPHDTVCLYVYKCTHVCKYSQVIAVITEVSGEVRRAVRTVPPGASDRLTATPVTLKTTARLTITHGS